MAAPEASRGGSSDLSLIKRLWRLNFRSPSPATSSSSRAGEHLLGRPSDNAAPLPSYLAHLAASPSSSKQSARRPSASQQQQQQPQQSHAPANPHVQRPTATSRPYPPEGTRFGDGYVLTDRLPPRPPAFVFSSSSANRVHSRSVPSSLRPASIDVGSSSQRVAFPWELVPQAKPVGRSTQATASPSFHTNEKENDDGVTQGSAQGPTTPPRSRHSLQFAKRDAAASMTPKGSQTDPRHPPSKGQCWGITKKNLRCTRKARGAANSTGTGSFGSPKPRRASAGYDRGASAPARLVRGTSASDPLVVSDSDDGDLQSPSNKGRARRQHSAPHSDDDDCEDVEEVYCSQHVAEAKKWSAFYHSRSPDGVSGSTTSRTLVRYEDWIQGTYLDDHTQVLLRNCMRRTLTETDRNERGHLYIYELLALSTATHVCLKVGRSTQVFRRIGEWNSQCHSKQPLLRAIYPSQDNQQLMPGMDTPTMQGVPLSRRWEALVHLELSALAERVDEVCHDCGKRHREIFMIPRWLGYRDASRQQQPEGFEMAKQVILKWLRFVQMLASPESK